MQAEFEPGFCQAGPQDAAMWGRFVSDVQKLETRISTLHLLIEGKPLRNSLFPQVYGFEQGNVPACAPQHLSLWSVRLDD